MQQSAAHCTEKMNVQAEKNEKQQEIVHEQLRKVRAQQRTCVRVLNFQCVHCDAHDYLAHSISLASASGAKIFVRVRSQ